MTGVGGTYLCTKPTAATDAPRTTYIKANIGGKCRHAWNTAHAAEVAWTFSGGGFSHVFSRPDYQAAPLPADSTAIPASARGVPDIAFQASAGTGALVYLFLPPDGNGSNVNQTGWYHIGGTSLSCPQWAGLVAIADQINKENYNQLGLGLINPLLYKLAANPTTYSNDFFDIAKTGDADRPNDNQGDPSVPRVSGDEGLGSGHGSRDAERGALDPGSRQSGAQLAARAVAPRVEAPKGRLHPFRPSNSGGRTRTCDTRIMIPLL